VAVGLLLVAVATSALALIEQTQGATVATGYLRTGDAVFGDGVRIRERRAGLQAWSAERTTGRIVPTSRWRVGLDYAYTRFAFEGLPTRPRDLHHLRVPLAWRHPDDRWLMVAAPIVATSSNVFKDFLDRGTSDDVDLHLRLQMQRWRGASHGWRVALLRDSAFGKPRIYPEAAFLWRSPRAYAELGLPSSRAQWQLRPALAV